MSDIAKIEYAYDLMRRMPPNKVHDTLLGLLKVAPELTEELLYAADVPLKIAYDKYDRRGYLCGDYNRDENSYRSPFSNVYDPPLKEGCFPSAELRAKIEIKLNYELEKYRLQRYCDNSLHSAYCWNTDNGNFAAAIFLKASAEGLNKVQKYKGTWDSIHTMDVVENANKSAATYNLTSTLIMAIENENTEAGTSYLGGSITKQATETRPLNYENAHVDNIMYEVDAMERQLRMTSQTTCFDKIPEIVKELHCPVGVSELWNREHARVIATDVHA